MCKPVNVLQIHPNLVRGENLACFNSVEAQLSFRLPLLPHTSLGLIGRDRI